MSRLLKITAIAILFLIVLIAMRSVPAWVEAINENTRLSRCLNLLHGYHVAFWKAQLAAAQNENHNLFISPELLLQEKFISDAHFQRMKDHGFAFEKVHPDSLATTPIARFTHKGWEVVLLKNGEILKVPPED